MRSVNKVILVGNVGVDPDIRVAMNGNKIAKFSLATSDQWTDKQTGEKREKTAWHRCTVFGRLSDVIEQYVRKGDRLYVEGALEYSTSEADGVTRYWTDIIVRDMVMLGGSGGGAGGGATGGGARSYEPRQTPQQTPQQRPTYNTNPEDDLPF